LRQGDISEAFEAAKSLFKLRGLTARHIAEVLSGAEGVHNREAAVYALAWLRRRDVNETLRALLNIFNDVNEHPAVRGQALEGLGIQRPTRRHKTWPEVERATLKGLADESAEVRFWACYAAGTLGMKSALPRLGELSRNDTTMCPGWWRVSEEAADAIEWIHERNTETRVQLRSRIENDGEA
jgi:HEAT repeat protein